MPSGAASIKGVIPGMLAGNDLMNVLLLDASEEAKSERIGVCKACCRRKESGARVCRDARVCRRWLHYWAQISCAHPADGGHCRCSGAKASANGE